jgi:hypothetical protein
MAGTAPDRPAGRAPPERSRPRRWLNNEARGIAMKGLPRPTDRPEPPNQQPRTQPRRQWRQSPVRRAMLEPGRPTRPPAASSGRIWSLRDPGLGHLPAARGPWPRWRTAGGGGARPAGSVPLTPCGQDEGGSSRLDPSGLHSKGTDAQIALALAAHPAHSGQGPASLVMRALGAELSLAAGDVHMAADRTSFRWATPSYSPST